MPGVEFDESDPVNDVTRATLIDVGVTPGALAVLPTTDPLEVAVVGLAADPVVGLAPETDFLALPHAVAAKATTNNPTTTARPPR